MARPRIDVQHLVFCTGVSYPDRRRPFRECTLDGVDYEYRVPPDTEFPHEPDEFWLYIRFFVVGGVTGNTRPLSVTCDWLDAPGGTRPVWVRHLGPIVVHVPVPARDWAWAFRPPVDEDGPRYSFPGLGRYEFRLWNRRREWKTKRILAREYLRIEYTS